MVKETIFSQILNGEIPCDEVYSDDQCLAFRDVQPQAPIHILIIPRKRIENLLAAEEADTQLLGHLLFIGANIAKKEGLENWRTVINTGAEAGQTVFHLHVHIMGGRSFNWPPG